ncbi:UNKNOWN [Stylonychia lemnae]|uniref:Uncharacterized protein n=1 Tax=Stylonychia lemnae TaxID=5949 RepID=A0A077ZZ67_STYLE|nr:UNKNOWN [Stylonychia lemnae]|eukprot:CDW74508.1 UNKNOWN [Stylonychia lemnae]
MGGCHSKAEIVQSQRPLTKIKISPSTSKSKFDGQDFIIAFLDDYYFASVCKIFYKLYTFGDLIRLSLCSRKLYEVMGSRKVLENVRIFGQKQIQLVQRLEKINYIQEDQQQDDNYLYLLRKRSARRFSIDTQSFYQSGRIEWDCLSPQKAKDSMRTPFDFVIDDPNIVSSLANNPFQPNPRKLSLSKMSNNKIIDNPAFQGSVSNMMKDNLQRLDSLLEGDTELENADDNEVDSLIKRQKLLEKQYLALCNSKEIQQFEQMSSFNQTMTKSKFNQTPNFIKNTLRDQNPFDQSVLYTNNSLLNDIVTPKNDSFNKDFCFPRQENLQKINQWQNPLSYLRLAKEDSIHAVQGPKMIFNKKSSKLGIDIKLRITKQQLS